MLFQLMLQRVSIGHISVRGDALWRQAAFSVRSRFDAVFDTLTYSPLRVRGVSKYLGLRSVNDLPLHVV